MNLMHIAYLHFRIAGIDGVTLETQRWQAILTRMGHEVTFIAGELDQPGILIPQLHFTHPQIYKIHEMVVNNHINYKEVEKEIFALAGVIEGLLREAFRKHGFDKLIVSNVFSLPIHFPFAVALERVIAEFKIPTIARHHDFWWERERYAISSCFEFFKRFFPPQNPLISHITINSIAQKELKKRTGLDSIMIGDSFDFKSKADLVDGYNKHWRGDFGIAPDDIVFLQATRIVPRKQIELSIELVSRLNNPKVMLVMAGSSGDEGNDYLAKLKKLCKKAKIKVKFIGGRVQSRREIRNHTRFYTLWDCFVNCNLSTYPSFFEGFGNQFIEAVYFKKPVFINRYSVYKADLEPLGFETVYIDGKVTDKAVKQVRELLEQPEKVQRMVEKNFKIGARFFSFEATGEKLKTFGF